jgi:hypothetical protein
VSAKSVSVCGAGGASDCIFWVRSLKSGQNGVPAEEGNPRRARVSRVAFYAHFADKEDCFLTATAEGRELMTARIVSATRALPGEARDEEVLRVALRAYLAFLAGEPAFARGLLCPHADGGPARRGPARRRAGPVR